MDLSDPNFLRTLAAWADTGQGRSLSELLNSNDPLQGPESQRPRSYFTSNWMEPDRDLDDYGRRIMMGDLASVQDDFARRESQHMAEADTTEATRADAAQELYSLRWGPTRVPIFNLILLCTCIEPRSRAGHLAIARWLIADAKVPVDGTDLSGSQAIYHTISTKPTFDPEYGQLLYDAGANVNHRNRYGGTAAHEMALIWDYTKKEPAQRAADGLAWFFAHGGNIDIKDNDGQTVRTCVDATRARGLRRALPTWDVVDREDERRKRLGMKICAFCGRVPEGDKSLPQCSRCRKASYCAAPRACQKADWPKHKHTCNLLKPSTAGMTYLGVKLGA